MTMIRYQPWGLRAAAFDQLQRELSRMLDVPAAGLEADAAVATDWVPAVDVKEEDGRWLVRADLPGVDPAAIEVTMADGALTIRGSRSAESTEAHDGWRRVERVSGNFYRRFTLPDTADATGIKAASKDGVLELTIPKQPKVLPKRIAVNG